jgi:transposase
MGKARLPSWEVSDEFWVRVEPLLPPTPGRDKKRHYARAEGAGRKRKDPRLIFAAVVYVLRTGCQWKALPVKRFGSASSIQSNYSA